MVSQFWSSSDDALEWVRWYTFSKDAIANIGRNLQTHFYSSHHPILGVMHLLLTKQVVIKYFKSSTKVCEEKALFLLFKRFSFGEPSLYSNTLYLRFHKIRRMIAIFIRKREKETYWIAMQIKTKLSSSIIRMHFGRKNLANLSFEKQKKLLNIGYRKLHLKQLQELVWVTYWNCLARLYSQVLQYYECMRA